MSATNGSASAVGESLVAWMTDGTDRGTFDLVWSACSTMILACWVATCPNAGSMNDKWYHAVRDKFGLAVVGLLGADMLYGIAVGQYSSARRSVKQFRNDPKLLDGRRWTLTEAFFLDMGGLHLATSDFASGFVINAEQFYYLLKHNFIDFPDLDAMNIADRNMLESLSRIIAVAKALWFLVIQVQRVRIGLPMTTLELTALSFTFTLFATSVVWYKKPQASRPRLIHARQGVSTVSMRRFARDHTHFDLDLEDWRTTPLDFIGCEQFNINVHWRQYLHFADLLHINVISRPIMTRPHDRYPSDLWLPLSANLSFIGAVICIGFHAIFLLGWNFYFPSKAERLLWQGCSVFMVVFGCVGATYYAIEMVKTQRAEKLKTAATITVRAPTGLADLEIGHELPPQSSSLSNERSSPLSISQDETALIPAKRSSCTLLRVPSAASSISSSGRTALPAVLSDSGAGMDVLETIGSIASTPEVTRGQLVRHWNGFAESWKTLWRTLFIDRDTGARTRLRVFLPLSLVCGTYMLCRAYMYIEDFVALRAQPPGIYQTVDQFVPWTWGA